MQPLVLAIEPDIRQAAIVKRIVRERVQADVAVVDSRDAALEAMRTTIPDVLLLSALLSPRDEDELIAHLRTLRHAEHLQTHTIPQLASTIDHDGDKPRGLLSAFRRRKASGSSPAGCDPDLFADEIRTYLQRASEKKRELRENPAREAAVSTLSAVTSAAAPSQDDTHAGDVAQPESSWSSPFEWRPARSDVRSAKKSDAASPAPAPIPRPEPAVAAAPEPTVVAVAEPAVAATPEPVRVVLPKPAPGPEPAAPTVATPEQSAATAGSESAVIAESDSVAIAREESVVAARLEPEAAPDAETVVVAAPQSVLIPQPRSVLMPRAEVAAKNSPPAARKKLPLSKRHAREWWFEGEDTTGAHEAKQTDSEMRELLASLSVPLHVAAIGYAEGCRIRRVRLAAD